VLVISARSSSGVFRRLVIAFPALLSRPLRTDERNAWLRALAGIVSALRSGPGNPPLPVRPRGSLPGHIAALHAGGRSRRVRSSATVAGPVSPDGSHRRQRSAAVLQERPGCRKPRCVSVMASVASPHTAGRSYCPNRCIMACWGLTNPYPRVRNRGSERPEGA
jgi:hypothetical protein